MVGLINMCGNQWKEFKQGSNIIEVIFPKGHCGECVMTEQEQQEMISGYQLGDHPCSLG